MKLRHQKAKYKENPEMQREYQKRKNQENPQVPKQIPKTKYLNLKKNKIG